MKITLLTNMAKYFYTAALRSKTADTT